MGYAAPSIGASAAVPALPRADLPRADQPRPDRSGRQQPARPMPGADTKAVPNGATARSGKGVVPMPGFSN